MTAATGLGSAQTGRGHPSLAMAMAANSYTPQSEGRASEAVLGTTAEDAETEAVLNSSTGAALPPPPHFTMEDTSVAGWSDVANGELGSLMGGTFATGSGFTAVGDDVTPAKGAPAAEQTWQTTQPQADSDTDPTTPTANGASPPPDPVAQPAAHPAGPYISF